MTNRLSHIALRAARIRQALRTALLHREPDPIAVVRLKRILNLAEQRLAGALTAAGLMPGRTREPVRVSAVVRRPPAAQSRRPLFH